MRYILFVCLLASVLSVSAQDTPYWSIEIDTPDYAKNIERETFDRYFTKTVVFEVQDLQPDVLAEFYSSFFAKLGWSDPTADFPNRSGLPGEWAAYSMRFNTNDEPEATYAKSWQSADIPAIGTLNLVLTDYSSTGFSGKATVAISPNVDMSPMMQLNDLLGNDPMNLFVLYQALGSNPFDVQETSIPPNYLKETDPLLRNYYQIVNEVEENFREFGKTYVTE